MNEVETAARLRGSFLESVLLQMNERCGSMSHDELDAFTTDPRGTVEALGALYGLALVEQPDSEGGRLTPFGKRTAELIKRSLLTGSRRADAVQRAVLEWLNEQKVEPSSLGELLDAADQATAYGVPMTEQEVVNAADLLEERGFIKALHTLGARFLRPSITADGRAALMSHVLISEYGWSNPTMITNDYSSRVTFGDNATAGGVIAGGQSHNQTVIQVLGPSQAEAFGAKIAEVAALLDQLSDTAAKSDLRAVVEQLRNEVAAHEPRQSVVKDLVLKATGTAVAVLGTEAGNKVVEGLGQLAQML